jgi:hypothetical protein
MLRWGTGVFIALVVAVAAAVFLLPQLLTGEFVRAVVRDSIGSELEFERLELDPLERRLSLFAPTLTGGETYATAQSVEMDVALAPLLARVLLVDKARVEAPSVRLVRSHSGVRLIGDAEAESSASDDPIRGFAIKAVDLQGGTLRLEDRTVSPVLNWELRDIEASAVGTALDAPVDFTVSGELASGGRVRAKGDSTLAGALNAQVELEAVSLEPAAPYFESTRRVAGLLSGTIDVSPQRVRVEWTVQDARLRLDDISLRGAVVIEARIRTGGGPEAGGRIELDATDARLRYGDFFTKPRGTPAKVTGRIRAEPDGSFRIERWKFEMSDFEGQTDSPV